MSVRPHKHRSRPCCPTFLSGSSSSLAACSSSGYGLGDLERSRRDFRSSLPLDSSAIHFGESSAPSGSTPPPCCCGRPESWPVSPSCAGPSVPEGWPEAKFPPGFRFQAAGHPWHLSWACSSVASSSASPRVRVFPLVHMLSSGPQCRFFLARYPEALRRAPSRSRALQQGRTARSNHSVKPTCLRHAAYLKR